VEDMENKIRSTLNEIYFGKTRDIVNGLRSVQPLAEARKTKDLQVTETPILVTSVEDPNPDPPDPHVFGPPGSGSTSQRYGSGSGSFCHNAKIVRKTLSLTIL
jgi:hypothetical protein